MRFFKKTIFWFITLAILGGSLYIIDKKMEERKAIQEEKRRLFTFEPGDVTGFQIVKGDKVIKVRRVEVEGKGQWILEAPVLAPGDEKAIDNLLNHVVKAKMDGVLFESTPPGKLQEMGLERPYLEVQFKTKAGSSKTIAFGDRGPTQNVAFSILRDDPRVFRIHADIRAEADKTVYDLRDKTVLAFEPLKIEGFEIAWRGGKTITVKHPEEGKWHIIQSPHPGPLPSGERVKVEDIADAVKVTELLYKVRNSEVKAFIDEEPKDLAPYGLDRPRVRFTILDEKNTPKTLLIGERDKKERGLFAKRGDSSVVFLLEEDFINTLPMDEGALLEKEAKTNPSG